MEKSSLLSKDKVSLEESVSILLNSTENPYARYKRFLDYPSEFDTLPELTGEVQLLKRGLLGEYWSVREGYLHDRRFKLYKSGNQQPRTCINFDLSTCELAMVEGKTITIQPLESSKVIQFKTSNVFETYEWAVALFCHYICSRGIRERLTTIVCHKRYWKRSFATFRQILKEAQTGDLLLFKSKNMASLALRIASRAEFDHVGMFIRSHCNEELYFVEALGSGGVQIHKMSSFLVHGWFNNYRKLYHRQLVCQRTRHFEDVIIQKTREWIGTPYSLSIKKLARKSTTGEYSTFFCSELVAAYYKALGFIESDIRTSKFWPSSFGANKKIQMQGAYLGELSIIVFPSK